MNNCVFTLSDDEYAAWEDFCSEKNLPLTCSCVNCNEMRTRIELNQIEATRAPSAGIMIRAIRRHYGW